MQLRRFTADSTPAALSAVRHALGDDAIILANRRMGDHVEIIATGQMEDEATLAQMSMEELKNSSSESSSYSGTSDKPVDSHNFNAAFEASEAYVEENDIALPVEKARDEEQEREHQNENSTRTLQEDTVNISELSKAIESASTGTRPLHPLPPVGSMPQPLKSAEKPNLQHADVSSYEPKPSAPRSHSSECQQDSVQANLAKEQLEAALASQTEIINNQFKSLRVNLWGRSEPERGLHLQQLLSLGIGAELAIRLVERAEPGTPLEVAIRQSFALLKSTLPVGSDKTMSVPGVTIMSGAPGSGKTTALVKLATEHVKRSGTQSIVIVSADIRRIGAFEELQAYGRLLGVPTVHAHDTGELDSLLHAFNHKDLVLIDHTLPGDVESIQLTDSLLNPTVTDSVRHLFALPAHTQSASAESLISRHCAGKSMQCVLTHLDTNARLGELFNAIIRHHLPIAYWSDSASVQSPLRKADASVLVASAVAMSRRISHSPDDEWLQRLIQPSQAAFYDPGISAGQTELEAS